MQIEAGKTSIRYKETEGKQSTAWQLERWRSLGVRGPERGARVGKWTLSLHAQQCSCGSTTVFSLGRSWALLKLETLIHPRKKKYTHAYTQTYPIPWVHRPQVKSSCSACWWPTRLFFQSRPFFWGSNPHTCLSSANLHGNIQSSQVTKTELNIFPLSLLYLPYFLSRDWNQ